MHAQKQPTDLSVRAFVDLRRCDLGSKEDFWSLTARVSSFQPLVGLIHAGGILRDATLRQQTAQHVRDGFAPKAANVQAMHQVQRPQLAWMHMLRLAKHQHMLSREGAYTFSYQLCE